MAPGSLCRRARCFMRRRDLRSRSGNLAVRAARRTGSVLVVRRRRPATALDRLADPDPIDGLVIDHAVQATGNFEGKGRECVARALTGRRVTNIWSVNP